MDEGEIAPGTRFGRFEIVAKLGDGGMGAVYEARHIELRQPVAVKVLHTSVARNEVARARMLREGRAAARSRHPNIVQVHDAGMDRGMAYLVMEKLDGEDLKALIDREAPFSVERVADLLLPVLAALDAAHREGVVHRDLKPSNVFITKSPGGTEIPKVVDFGISKLRDATLGLTRTSEVLGTPAYMAPEQMEEAREVDGRADIYAVGVIMYECLTKRAPFASSKGPMAMLHAIGEGKFVKPRELAADLPEAFETIVLRAMAVEADERFGSALELADALLPFASDAGRARFAELDPRDKPAPKTAAKARASKARWPFFAALAALVALGLGGVVAIAWPGEPEPPPIERYRVVVETEPADAEIRLDVRDPVRGRLDVELERDGATHTLLVQAEGYEPFTRQFTDAPPEPRIALSRIARRPRVRRPAETRTEVPAQQPAQPAQPAEPPPPPPPEQPRRGLLDGVLGN